MKHMTPEQIEAVLGIRAGFGKRRVMVRHGKPELCGAVLAQTNGESWLVFKDGRVVSVGSTS